MNGSTAAILRIPDYELIRLVGQGAYGEVWMARNALGSPRAVKVVWRRNFEDDRPYEREFHGIRKYEPVSRKHEGLIDIYHVGRNNEAGYFYYVMELADDATSSVNSAADYRPFTLREEMRARGRMSVSRCVEVGAKLASALAHLHQAGLVHRDIKPSNIIFIGGAPKLADIGLVAGISDARSYVGTEGFVPPEGPGSPAADIFSLGKVLYEMSTGMDRNEFPRLPTVGGEAGLDAREFAEFNEVLVKACEPEVKLRYKSAPELFEELVFLQGGKSLRRVRGLERRTAFLSKVGIAAATIAILASVGYYGSFKQFQRAVRAEQQAVAHLQFLEMQTAEELFRRDDSSGALAYLAHIVRSNPTNRVAAERLMSALTWRNFLLPSLEPIAPAGRLRLASFDEQGQEFVSGSANGTLQFWDALSGGLTLEFKAASDEVLSFDWSKDQSRLAIGTAQGCVLHDFVMGRSMTLGNGTGPRAEQVRLSPDQRWVFVSGPDGTVRIWDAEDGQPTERTLPHGARVHRIVFSPDGRLVVTAGVNDGAARLWDPATAQPTSQILRHGNRINEIVFSADGNILATAGEDGTARFWRVPDGHLLGRVTHRAQVSDIAFSPDGGRIATASEDGTAVLWDWDTRQPVGAPMRHRAWVKGVEFSPDGLKLVTISEDNMARLWDAKTALPLSEPIRHPQSVISGGFSPQGERLLTGVSSPNENGLWVWKTSKRSAITLQFSAGTGKRSAQLLEGSGKFCIVADRAMRMWSTRDHDMAPETIDLGVPVDLFQLSANGQRAAVVYGSKAWIWDLTSRQSIKGPLGHPSAVMAAQFSPDANTLALATDNGHLLLWRIQPAPGERPSDRCLPLPDRPDDPTLDQGIVSIRFNQDGRKLVVACRNRTARIFDTQTGGLLLEVAHEHAVLSAEFSPDGRRILTASSDRTAQIWDAITGSPVGQAMHHDNDVLLARFSPDGKRVATASRDWTARIWDAQTGLPVSQILSHGGPVQAVCFSPDGIRLATGSVDETARIWDVETGQPLTDAYFQNGPVEALEFSRDGSQLVIVPSIGAVQLINVVQPVVPAPDWLPKLAEAVVRHRLNRRQMAESVPAAQWFELKRDLDAREASDANLRWVKWFLADPDSRPISPDSTLGRSSYVARLVKGGKASGLREAIALEPANARAHMMLAQAILVNEQSLSNRDLTEANWHRRQARRLSPDDQEIANLSIVVYNRIRAIRGESVPR